MLLAHLCQSTRWGLTMADVNSAPHHPDRRNPIPDPAKPVYRGPERRKTPRQELVDHEHLDDAPQR
jgi:hypothetical protein